MLVTKRSTFISSRSTRLSSRNSYTQRQRAHGWRNEFIHNKLGFFTQRRTLWRICVVGAGPAGFYATEEILHSKLFAKEGPKAVANSKSGESDVRVDILEKYPTPFGLVRYGVAPDHPEVKVVEKKFEELMCDPRVRFLGNVAVGTSVQLDELRELYDAVVLAYGAESERKLGIPGEDSLQGVYSARSFVGWYNGLPENQNDEFDLSKEAVAIFGNGNVAIDVARILLRPIDELKTTDITEAVLAALASSKVREVHIIGRRGPVQAAFTTKELRELTKITGCQTLIYDDKLPLTPTDELELQDRPKKRQFDVLKALLGQKLDRSKKQIYLHFHKSPVELLPDKSSPPTYSGKLRLGAVKLEHNRLEGTTPGQQVAVGTGEFSELKCDIAFRSIGYKSLPIPGVPFDTKRGIVPNIEGRVIISETDKARNGFGDMYVVGWLKRGPSGIIGTNKWDAVETIQSLINDIMEGNLPKRSHAHVTDTSILELLRQKGIDAVTYADWKVLDTYEIELGKKVGKPREKVVNVPEMLKIIRSAK